jgi:YesN/AraC family two-component response regulator
MPPQPPASPTAIVADDERLMRDQLIGRLKEAWPELEIVGEATNGSEAVALAQSEEPDIVFLDIQMPGMDGIQAARSLAGQAHIVFVTAYDQYAIRAFEYGAVDYLLKPAEPERVALTCERLRAKLEQKPAPMDDLLAQLSERLGSGGRRQAARVPALGAGERRRQHPDDPHDRTSCSSAPRTNTRACRPGRSRR